MRRSVSQFKGKTFDRSVFVPLLHLQHEGQVKHRNRRAVRTARRALGRVGGEKCISSSSIHQHRGFSNGRSDGRTDGRTDEGNERRVSSSCRTGRRTARRTGAKLTIQCVLAFVQFRSTYYQHRPLAPFRVLRSRQVLLLSRGTNAEPKEGDAESAFPKFLSSGISN